MGKVAKRKVESVKPKSRNARVIAVGNQRGGVGKTANTVHIALAESENLLFIFGL